MNDYRREISGFILPKTTGNYIFFIAADDNAGLWLSTDDTAAKLTQIASEPQWNQVRTWTSTSRRPGCPDNGGAKCENRSNPIRLEAGKRYYMEALVKEGGGGDNLAVTMIKEGDAEPTNNDPPTLTGDLIGTFVETTVAIITQPQDVKTEDGNTVSFSVSGSAAVGTTYQWSKKGTAIAGATSPRLRSSQCYGSRIPPRGLLHRIRGHRLDALRNDQGQPALMWLTRQSRRVQDRVWRQLRVAQRLTSRLKPPAPICHSCGRQCRTLFEHDDTRPKP